MPHSTHPHHRSPASSQGSADATTLLINATALPGSPDARRLIGADHGGLPFSLFLVNGAPGAGPPLHRHPYPELFIVHAGQADFEVDGDTLTATGGDILIAPAHTAHRFTNVGRDQLHITAIHTAPAMNTEWLDQSRKDPEPLPLGTARRHQDKGVPDAQD